MITASILATTLIVLFVGGVFVFIGYKVPAPFGVICQAIGGIIIILAVLDFLLALLNHAPIFSI
jgi:hypothetical protein